MLQSLLTDAQTKLDTLLLPPFAVSPPDAPDQVQGPDEVCLYPYIPQEVELESAAAGEKEVGVQGDVVKERERELWMVGAAGAIVGIGISALVGLLGS